MQRTVTKKPLVFCVTDLDGENLGGDLAAIAALSLEARTQCPIHKTCDQSHVSSDGNNWDQRTGGAEKANF